MWADDDGHNVDMSGKQLKEQVRLKETCQTCHKSIGDFRKASITGWFLRSAMCSCEKFDEELNVEATTKEKSDENAAVPDLGEQFEVLELIGEGGMGKVYKVLDKESSKLFAIKALNADLAKDVQAVKRFEQEAKATSELTHPNLVAVYGTGNTADGAPYIIMDYLNGESLSSLVKREGALEQTRALNLIVQVCEALSYAHQKGMVHRDLKPTNIIVTKEGDSEHVHLVDFGIAKLHSDIRSTLNLTSTGDVLGSPSYMSPEQCLGLSVDVRSDIYSVGCVLFEIVTGKKLFTGQNPVQIVAKHLHDEPWRSQPTKLASWNISGWSSDIVSTCIQKDPLDRYHDTDELLSDLQRAREGKEPSVALVSKRHRRYKEKKILWALSMLGGAFLVAQLPVVEPWGTPFSMIIALMLAVLSLISCFALYMSAAYLSIQRTLRFLTVAQFIGLLSRFSSMWLCGAIMAVCVLFLLHPNVSLGPLLLWHFSVPILFILSLNLMAMIAGKTKLAHIQLTKTVAERSFEANMRKGLLVLFSACLAPGLVMALLTFESDSLKISLGIPSPYHQSNEDELTTAIDSDLQKRAMLYFNKGDFGKAYRDLDMLLEDESRLDARTLKSALGMRGFCGAMQGRLDMGQKDLERANTIQAQGVADLNYMCAWFAVANHQPERALQFLAKANEKDRCKEAVIESFCVRMEGDEVRARDIIRTALNEDVADSTQFNYLTLKYLNGTISADQYVADCKPEFKLTAKTNIGLDLLLKGDRAKAKELFLIELKEFNEQKDKSRIVVPSCVAMSQLNRINAEDKGLHR